MMNLLRVTVLISFLFYIDTTVSQKIEVGRFIIGDKWKNVKDLFNIPDSECEQNGRYGNYCLSVCGTGTDAGNPRYPCSCPNDNSTLTYFNNEWRCRENTEVREQLGCKVNNLFFNEKIKHKLRTLNTTKERRTKLTKDCSINLTLSWYIGCHGEREPIARKTSFILKWLRRRNKTFSFLKVTNDSFQGRIINLGISCTSGRFTNSCLLFKVEGNLTCPIMKPHVDDGFSSTMAPIATSSYSIATTTPTSTPSTAFSKTSTQPKKNPSQNPSNSQPSSGIRQMGNDDSSSTLGIIIGVTLSTAIVILLIAAVFCYRRHKSRKDAHTPTAHQMKANILNAAFTPEVQNGYFNTSNNETGNSHSGELYASLDVPEGHNIYGHLNAQGPVYNGVQEPFPGDEEEEEYYGYEDLSGTIPGRAESVGPNRVEPVYNTLEEPYQDGSPRSECCNTSSVDEPFYNTLEESNANDNSQGTNEESVYNTLEEPYLGGAGEDGSFGPTSFQHPVNNVLECPATNDVDSNIPVYAAVNKRKSEGTETLETMTKQNCEEN